MANTRSVNAYRRFVLNIGTIVVTFLPSCATRPLCPPQAQVAPDWITVKEETGTFELRMPPSLQLAPREKYFFMHGGQVWENATTKVSIAFGHWAEDSFQAERGERCRVSIGDASVYMITSDRAVLAWYDRDSAGHEPVVRVSSDTDSIGALSAIALSLKPLDPIGHE